MLVGKRHSVGRRGLALQVRFTPFHEKFISPVRTMVQTYSRSSFLQYSGSSEERRLRAILLVDTLNFCFWPCSDWEYDRYLIQNHIFCASAHNFCRLASAVRNAAVHFDKSGCNPDPLDPQWLVFCRPKFPLPYFTAWTAGGPF